MEAAAQADGALSGFDGFAVVAFAVIGFTQAIVRFGVFGSEVCGPTQGIDRLVLAAQAV